MSSCALDKSSLSIERVKVELKVRLGLTLFFSSIDFTIFMDFYLPFPLLLPFGELREYL